MTPHATVRRPRRRGLALPSLALLAAACSSTGPAQGPPPPAPERLAAPFTARALPEREAVLQGPLRRWQLPPRARFSRDGRLLAVDDGDDLELRDGRSGAVLARVPLGPHGDPSPLSEIGATIAWSQDDRQLAVAVDDRLVVVDAARGAVTALGPLPDPRHVGGLQPRSCVFSPDGRHVVVEGRLTAIWDVVDHSAVVLDRTARSLALSPDGARVALADVSGDLLVLDGGSGATLRRWDGDRIGYASAVAFRGDGRQLAYGTETGAVQIVDAATFRDGVRSSPFPLQVGALAFHPSGRAIAVGFLEEHASEHPRRLRTIGQLLGGPRAIPEHLDVPYAVAWEPATGVTHPTRRSAAVVELAWTADGALRVRPGEERFDVDGGGARVGAGGGLLLASDDGSVTLDVGRATIEHAATLTPRGGPPVRLPVEEADDLPRLLVAPAAWRAVWDQRRERASVVDLARGTLAPLPLAGRDAFSCETGERLLACVGERAVVVQDLVGGAPRKLAAPDGASLARGVTFGAKDALLAVATIGSPVAVVVWRSDGARPIARLPIGADDELAAVAGFSPDGRRVALVLRHGSDEALEVRALSGGAVAWRAPMPHGYAWSATDVFAFDPERAGDGVRLVDGASGRAIATVPGASVASFTPDGKRLLVQDRPDDFATGCLFSLEGRRCEARLPTVGRFSPDGARYVTEGFLDGVRVFDTATGRVQAQRWQRRSPAGLVWLGGDRLAVVDRTVRLWSLRDSATVELVPLDRDGAPQLLAFAPDGTVDGTDAALSIVRVREGRDLRSATLRSVDAVAGARVPGLVARFLGALGAPTPGKSTRAP